MLFFVRKTTGAQLQSLAGFASLCWPWPGTPWLDLHDHNHWCGLARVYCPGHSLPPSFYPLAISTLHQSWDEVPWGPEIQRVVWTPSSPRLMICLCRIRAISLWNIWFLFYFTLHYMLTSLVILLLDPHFTLNQLHPYWFVPWILGGIPNKWPLWW